MTDSIKRTCPDWEPKPPIEWEPEIADHVPANMDWLEYLIAEVSSRRAARQAYRGLRLLPPMTSNRQACTSKKTVLQLVGKGYSPKRLNKCCGGPAIVKIAYEIETVMQYFSSTTDEDSLLEAEPHLRRVDHAVRTLTRRAARIRHQRMREKRPY